MVTGGVTKGEGDQGGWVGAQGWLRSEKGEAAIVTEGSGRRRGAETDRLCALGPLSCLWCRN